MHCGNMVISLFTMGSIISWSKLPGIVAKSKSMPRWCKRPPRYGNCNEAFQNFYFNPKKNLCQTFIYSGCGGNKNNFATLVDCLYECERFVLITPWKDLAGDMKWRRDPDPECKPRWRKGRCRHKLTRYYYDVKNKRCRPFTYSGCGGNYNNYATYEQCAQKCEPFGSPDYSKHPERNPETKPHTCNLPVDVGPCNASFPRFYYDAKTKSCKPFNFGGCNGNSNNFGTIEDCILECKNRGKANDC
nr:PREDICTED: carboxypeptidase inhibitor SmCI [Anolis carolinensis]|eukprot:XP_016851947.1 PREDICTED: carboxypeptidase inhibitor SmCI [Anolis carolinensis]